MVAPGWGCRRFTLIELLVVVAIIAILAALLSPALRKSRVRAMDLMCLSNHKQLGVGINVYTADFDGWLPPQGGFSFIVKQDGKPAGFGYLFEGESLDDSSIILLADPSYDNPNRMAMAGNDGNFNAFIRDVRELGHGYRELAPSYRYAPINYSASRWPPPPSLDDPDGWCGTWACSNPQEDDSVRVSDPYLDTAPIRTACMWNDGGGVEVPPAGTSWINPYTHQVRGVNVGQTDGSARWVPGEKIYPWNPGFVHHWRSQFWQHGLDML